MRINDRQIFSVLDYTTSMKWFEIEPPAEYKSKRAIKAALSDDGTVFIPAAVAGSEFKVMLCAECDGVVAVFVDRHLFVPVDWLAREFSEVADVCRAVAEQVRAEARAMA
jgi:hypothetical protein